jgi:hypothetical protein
MLQVEQLILAGGHDPVLVLSQLSPELVPLLPQGPFGLNELQVRLVLDLLGLQLVVRFQVVLLPLRFLHVGLVARSCLF